MSQHNSNSTIIPIDLDESLDTTGDQQSGRYSPNSITDIESCQDTIITINEDLESDDDGEYVWADLYRLWLRRRNSPVQPQ